MSWEVSDDFKAAVRRSHTAVVRVEVLRGGSTEAVVPVTGGSVQVDSTQANRRRLTVPLVDKTGALIPGTPQDLLYPNGDELRAWRGIDFGDDRPGIPADIAPRGVELVPVFTGPLFENDTDDQPDGVEISLDGYDRSKWVQRARWTSPHLINGGDRWVDVIRSALAGRMPGSIELDYSNLMDDPATVARDFAVGGDPQGDPWENLTKWAASGLGAELFFDGLGNPVLRDVPNLNTTEVSRTYTQGQGGGLLGVRKRISLEQAYNIVVATGQGTGVAAPVQAIAIDDDPESATYIGTIGRSPIWFTSPLLTTVSQCRKAAQSRLNKRIGSTITLGFSILPDPSLEAGAVFDVVRPRAKVDLRVIVDAFPIPFDVDAAVAVSARSRRSL